MSRSTTPSRDDEQSRDDEAPSVATQRNSYLKYNVYGIVFELPSKYIPPIQPLGRGAYGFVCGAVDAEACEEVAIKKIANAFESKLVAKRTLREIMLLKHMNHENIILLRSIITPPKKESFNDVYMVFDMMDADLGHIIRSKQALTADHCKYFVYQLLRGLKYIHSANVLHRDLKPNNLFVNENCDLKIGDFGMARSFSDTDFMTEYVVTRWYRAPELLLGWSDYTSAIDVWSVGCIMAEIINREPLFPGRDHVHQMRLIMELIGSPLDSNLEFLQSVKARKYLKQLPQCERQSFVAKFPKACGDAVDLLEKMLVFDPRERVSVEEALAHPFLSSLHDVDDEPVCDTSFCLDLDGMSDKKVKDMVWKETQKML